MSLLFVQCTFRSAQEEQMLSAAEKSWRIQLQKDSQVLGDEKMNFQKIYIKTIMDRTEYHIKNGTVVVKSVHPEVRKSLIQIMLKVDSWKDQRFNASDAIGMIYQQLKLDPKSSVEESIQ